MTASVKKALAKICNNEVFNDELYFTGGTALAYYLSHRVSEDIDVISPKVLNYKVIVSNMSIIGAKKLQDENVLALRIAGLFPDEYMIKFLLDNVKLEFFQGNRAIQKEILSTATFKNYENSKLKILDVRSVAKLKIVAFLMREKSRDLFDFGAIVEHKILSIEEIVNLFSKVDSKITSVSDIINFIELKKEPIVDESVYLSETHKIDFSFEEIKANVVKKLLEIINDEIR